VDKSVNATAGMAENTLKTITALTVAVEDVSDVILPQLKVFSDNPNDRELIQLARADHASFTKNVIDILVERSPLPSAPLSDHHTCRFGKWYDSLANDTLRASNAYRNILEPHHKVHHFGQKALDLYRSGNMSSAVEAAAEMSQAAKQVFACLDEMERLLAAEPTNRH
jgi:methyl-accepting chemotaxis protein